MGERYHAFFTYFSRLNGVIVHPDVLAKVDHIADALLVKDAELNFFKATSGFGPILQQLMDGLSNSSCYVIFATINYMNEVNTAGSMIQQEFLYALDEFGANRCILVCLDPEMLDRRNWKQIFKFRLGAFSGIDMTSEEKVIENIDVLRVLIGRFN